MYYFLSQCLLEPRLYSRHFSVIFFSVSFGSNSNCIIVNSFFLFLDYLTIICVVVFFGVCLFVQYLLPDNWAYRAQIQGLMESSKDGFRWGLIKIRVKSFPWACRCFQNFLGSGFQFHAPGSL